MAICSLCLNFKLRPVNCQMNQARPGDDSPSPSSPLPLWLPRELEASSSAGLPRFPEVMSIDSPSNVLLEGMAPEHEVRVMLELLMEDLNLAEDKKKVLRALNSDRKWTILQQHLTERYRNGLQEVMLEIEMLRAPQNNTTFLNKMVVSLRSRPIRWVTAFIDLGGLFVLLDYLNELQEVQKYHDFNEGTMNLKSYSSNASNP